MENKRKLSLGDKVYIVKMKQGQLILCPTCASGRHEELGYIVESVEVEKLEKVQMEYSGYKYLCVNDDYVDKTIGNFYYTKKEAQRIAKLRNKSWKKHQQMIKDAQKKQNDNPVKGLNLKLYPIKGK